MGVAIGIDYGSKRVGLAVSDDLKMIATPLETVHSADVVAYFKKFLEKKKIDVFVLGEPKNLKGEATDSSQLINNFAIHLSRTFPDIPVVRIDERFTSSLAMDTMIRGGASKSKRKEKGAIDQISATIILQSYLDRPLL